MKIPILDLKPAYDELRTELDAAYRRVMESGWLLLGKELESFESEYAASIGVAHCIGVANGLEAMQLVLMARGVGPGDEVIVPSHGYIATWLAVTHVGARPIPCEPDPLTYNLDAARLTALITPRTKVILPIHLYGQTADMEAINAIAAQHNLFVLEDAAQSHGARSHGKQAGALGHAAGDKALLATEKVDLDFKDDAIDELARLSAEINETVENIGARRLHTVMEKLLEDLSFDAPRLGPLRHRVDAGFVRERLERLVNNNNALAKADEGIAPAPIKLLRKLPYWAANGLEMAQLFLMNPIRSEQYQPAVR